MTTSTLDAMLDARSDRASSEAIIAACEAALDAHPESTAFAARLVRARYGLASRHLADREAHDEHQRAVAAGLAALGRVLGTALADAESLDEQKDALPASAIGVYYWTALSYGKTIEGLSLFRQPTAARRFVRLVRHAVALDETYFHAGPRRVLADFLWQAPGLVGGDHEEGKVHARRAVDLAPRFAENLVVLAEIYAAEGDHATSRRVLEAAVALPDDALAGAVAEQRGARKRAQALLEGGSR